MKDNAGECSCEHPLEVYHVDDKKCVCITGERNWMGDCCPSNVKYSTTDG